jgi:hypothetical protein
VQHRAPILGARPLISLALSKAARKFLFEGGQLAALFTNCAELGPQQIADVRTGFPFLAAYGQLPNLRQRKSKALRALNELQPPNIAVVNSRNPPSVRGGRSNRRCFS